jgi:CIC family chloride channel protein
MFKRIVLIATFGILTGVVASLAAILFVAMVELCNSLFWVTGQSRQDATAQSWFFLAAILVPAVGGLITGLLCHSTSEKRPLTLADTIRSAQTMKFSSPLKNGLTTALASIVSLGVGASAGQYGPLAHLGATLGAWISRVTRSTGYTGAMGLGCGVAAAIATAFNAPIAGLLFAHEVILRHYSLRSFAPITVSAATGYVIANFVFNRPPLLQIELLEPIHTPEFFIFIVIGVSGAYIATLFMRAILAARQLADTIIVPQIFKPAMAGVVLGIVGIWLPEVLGIGDTVLGNAVSGSVYSSPEMSIILVSKLLLTAFCLGFGFVGGLFSPSLMIGILFGALIGNVAPYMLGENHSIVAVYAICGMVAVASPVIGAPLTAILIVFELTRSYDLAIAAMVTVVFANLVGYQLIGRSIYDIQLREDGVDLSMGRDKAVMDSREISDYLSQNYVSTPPWTSLAEFRDLLVESGKSEGYIVGHEKEYLGTLTLVELAELVKEGVLMVEKCGDHTKREQIVLEPATSIWSAMDQVQTFVGESIPVVSKGEKELLLGVVYEASIVKAYMDTLHNVRREEHGAD